MSKRRWKQPNHLLWECVFVIAMFLMSDSFAISLLALAVMVFSCFKLKDLDLSEECDTGLHFNSRQCIDMAGNNRNMENRIKNTLLKYFGEYEGH